MPSTRCTRWVQSPTDAFHVGDDDDGVVGDADGVVGDDDYVGDDVDC